MSDLINEAPDPQPYQLGLVHTLSLLILYRAIQTSTMVATDWKASNRVLELVINAVSALQVRQNQAVFMP